MDIVYINGLRAETIIGIHPWEREERQTIVVDLEMGCDTTRPARSDKIDYALDYAKVSEQVIALVEASEFQLIETLAEAIARLLTLTCPGCACASVSRPRSKRRRRWV